MKNIKKNNNKILKGVVIASTIIFIIIYNFFIKDKDFEKLNSEDFVVDENSESFEQISKSSENISNINNIEETEKENQINKIKVYVIGEVKNPGVVELESGERIENAIILAGGTTENSDLSKINLAYPLEDGQKLIVPSINDKSEKEDFNGIQDNEGEEYLISGNNSSDKKEENEKININTDTVSELSKIPGIGETLANRIIEYRKQNGKFSKIEDIKNVSGIGNKKYENLKEYISVK